MELHEKMQKAHELLAVYTVAFAEDGDETTLKAQGDAVKTELKAMAAEGRAALVNVLFPHVAALRIAVKKVRGFPTSYSDNGDLVKSPLLELAQQSLTQRVQARFSLLATLAGRIVDNTISEDDLGVMNNLAQVAEMDNIFISSAIDQAVEFVVIKEEGLLK